MPMVSWTRLPYALPLGDHRRCIGARRRAAKMTATDLARASRGKTVGSEWSDSLVLSMWEAEPLGRGGRCWICLLATNQPQATRSGGPCWFELVQRYLARLRPLLPRIHRWAMNSREVVGLYRDGR